MRAERQVGYHRRGIGRGTVCEGQALAQAAGTGRASSELAIRRLPSLRLCFRSYPWAPEHMPRVAVVIRACSFTENDDIGAVQVCRASRCSSAFWMCASLEVLHDLISVVVIQCRQGGNIMASGPPSCSCSRYRRGIGRGTVCEGQALAQAAAGMACDGSIA